MKARVGAVLNGFSVERNDGRIERYDTPIHNFMNFAQLNLAGLFSDPFSGWAANSWTSNMSLDLLENTLSVKYALSGVYAQTGNTITRTSGDDLPVGGTLVWQSTGQWANLLSGGTVSSRTVSKSLTVSEGSSNLWHFRTEGAYPNVINQTILTSPGADLDIYRSHEYSNGVFTISNPATLVSRAPGSGLSVVCSTIRLSGANASTIHFFQLPSPITLNENERVIVGINDFVTTWTLDAFAPRELPTCPITGLTTACITQRLIPFLIPQNSFGTLCNDGQAPTRIWLVNDANKIVIPDDMGAIRAVIAPSVIVSALETIVAGGTIITPTGANEHLRGHQTVGTAFIGGTVKQIIWGNTTQLFGVIEFVTPQTISADQIITIGSQLQVIQDYIVP